MKSSWNVSDIIINNNKHLGISKRYTQKLNDEVCDVCYNFKCVGVKENEILFVTCQKIFYKLIKINVDFLYDVW